MAHTDNLFGKKVLKAIQPKERRARHRAKSIVMNRYFRETENPNYATGMDYLNTEAGVIDFDNETQNIVNKLIDIDAEALGKG